MPSYEDSLKYLDSFINYEREGFTLLKDGLDLERVRRALTALSSPQKSFIPVHVAGTKGKGSICSFTSSILSESGHTTGLFTSPHLIDVTERISLDGQAISRESFAEVVGTLKEVFEDTGCGKDLTYFEVLTLAAILYFKMKGAEYAVFETGLGGRLDATNVLEAPVSCISPISYDHMDVLGETLEEIAREKAAIIKPGSCCVSSPQNPEALEVIKEACLRAGTELFVVGEDIKVNIKKMDSSGSVFDISAPEHVYKDCRSVMAGDFQPTNAASAVGVCERLFTEGIPEETVKRGIESAFIPGRMEIISRNPLIVIDGAQNAESAVRLKYSVEQIFKYDRLILLLGISADKDIKGICQELAPLADEVILTRASTKRAASSELIRGYVKGGNVRMTRDTTEGLGLALRSAKKDDLILAAGSFYVIGEIRKLILG